MKKYIAIFLFYFCQTILSQEVSFCVQAHEDDWQLFNSKSIISDISRGTKVVFITLTAGDAGNISNDISSSYFLTRELGSVNSVKFASDINGKPEILRHSEDISVAYNENGNEIIHIVKRYVYKNTISYFLRLPDGGLKGEGFYSTKNESLFKLRNGHIKSITCVDNSTTYQGWEDLVKMIRQIIISEKGDDSEPWMYLSSTDSKYNIKDHNDHFFTSLAAIEAVNDFHQIGIVEWMSYYSKNKSSNLKDDEYQNATALFAVYCWTLYEKGYESSYDQYHKSWLPMDYNRIYRYPIPFFSKVENSQNKKVPILTYCVKYKTGENKGKLLIKANIFEKGRLLIKIYNSQGVIVDSKKIQYDNIGVMDIELNNLNISADMNFVTVILNDKYIDTQKVM